jgi:crotonobetaine/carnitine-CoA ligase
MTKSTMPWRPTLGRWLLEKAEENGDRRALVAAGTEHSYGSLAAASARVAAALGGLFEISAPVAVILPTSALSAEAFFGITMAGLIEVPIHPDYRGPYLSHVLNVTQCQGVICTAATLSNVLEVRAECPSLRHILVSGPDAMASQEHCEKPLTALGHPHSEISRLGDHIEAAPASVPLPDLEDLAPAVVMFTSGTTGPSKGAVYSHEALLNRSARVAEVSRYGSDTVIYSVFPLNHMSAKCMTLLTGIYSNGCAIIDAHFSASRFWDRCRQEGVSAFNYVGALLMMLFKQPATPADRDHGVRLARGGGVPPDLRQGFEQRFGVKLLEMYGMTEFPHIAGYEWATERRGGSVGKPAPDYDIRIVDPRDYEVPAGSVGELILRPKGPNATMLHYYRAPDATVRAFRNLWFHTGDLATLDADGYLYYRGRKKDAIRRRGENVSAWEVEQVLISHPDVLECSAFGVPSDLSEEEVMVAVVLRGAAPLAQVVEYCSQRMPDFALPRYWRVMAELPKTKTHSVRKEELRADGVSDETWDRRKAASS